MSDQEHEQPPLNLEPLLTFKEAMAYLRVSRSTLYRLMASQKVPRHKVGHNWRFYVSDLRASVRDVSPSGEEEPQAEAVLL
jgi:excisionase family DNA binding protein